MVERRGQALPLLFGLMLVLLLLFSQLDIINNVVTELSPNLDEVAVFFLSLAGIIAFFALIWSYFGRMVAQPV